MKFPIHLIRLLSVTLITAFLAVPIFGAATITIVNNNAAGVGFNDPTPKAPLGGNPGTTVGQQRLIAFQHAANIWGSKLDSNVQILVRAQFISQTCTATSAVLGSAGTTFIFWNFGSVGAFPGAEFPDTLYHSALADKRAGAELNPGNQDIVSNFNANLNGNPACLGGRGWYYGLDANEGTDIDLVAVVLHELGHGLGFSQFASVTSGAQPLNLTDVYGRNLLDLSNGLMWNQMTNAQRAASAINSRRVVWTGTTVNSQVPFVLTAGTPLLRVNSPSGIAGIYAVGTASFGPVLSSPGVTGNVVLGLDPADGAGPSTTDGCSPLTNAAAVSGKIALMDRGTCIFPVKVKNAQNAGAIAVIIADNAAGSPPAGLGGVDPTVVIPSVRVTIGDGNTIKANLGGGVNATLGVDTSVFAGADSAGRMMLNAPNPVAPGSSISHWDPVAFRNQLMEPSINSDLTHSVEPPQDLSLPLMRDIGWFPDADTDGIADDDDNCPNDANDDQANNDGDSQGDVCDADDDNDGVDDVNDRIPFSDMRATVQVGSCDSGSPNVVFADGSTLMDRLAEALASAKNHGDFLKTMNEHLNEAKKDGLLSTNQKGDIDKCLATSKLP